MQEDVSYFRENMPILRDGLASLSFWVQLWRIWAWLVMHISWADGTTMLLEIIPKTRCINESIFWENELAIHPKIVILN